MVKFQLTKKAIQDLNDIWEYTIETWSESQADDYYNMILKRCQEIAENPSFGKKYDQVKSNLSGIRANRHIIFYYSTSEDTVQIVRILHGRMDLKAEFK